MLKKECILETVLRLKGADMRYAKLIDGKLIYATNPLQVGARHIFTTDPTKYGYKPIVNDPPETTEDTYASFSSWEETETAIVAKYDILPVTPPEPTTEDKLMAQMLYTATITGTLLEGIYDV